MQVECGLESLQFHIQMVIHQHNTSNGGVGVLEKQIGLEQGKLVEVVRVDLGESWR